MQFTSVRALIAAGVIAVSLVPALPAAAADYTLSINTALATTDPLYKGLEAFRDNVAGASGGKIEVKLFPNSQLGPDERPTMRALLSAAWGARWSWASSSIAS